MKRKLALIFTLSTLICLFITVGAADALNATFPEQALVRILISRNVSKLTVEAEGMTIKDKKTDTVYVAVRGHMKAPIAGYADGLSINGQKFDSTHLVISSPQIISVAGNQKAHSPVEIIQDKKGDPRFLIVNSISLDKYVAGIINKEMLPNWPLEAKKAMAVAARTYTLFKKLKSPSPYYDLSDTTSDQVYGGFGAEDAESRFAAAQTQGEVLVYENLPIEAYYHSTCGGRTVSAAEVWGKDFPYLQSVKCDYCKESVRYKWKTEISAKEMALKFKIKESEIKHITISEGNKSESGHLLGITLSTNKTTLKMKAEKFRSTLGYSKIWSTRFAVFKNKDKFLFAGMGSGHGVGMCQWGAYGMAKEGKTYKEILLHYYTGVEIRKME